MLSPLASFLPWSLTLPERPETGALPLLPVDWFDELSSSPQAAATTTTSTSNARSFRTEPPNVDVLRGFYERGLGRDCPGSPILRRLPNVPSAVEASDDTLLAGLGTGDADSAAAFIRRFQ